MIDCLKWFMKIQFIFVINLGNSLPGKLLQPNRIQRNPKSKTIKVTPNCIFCFSALTGIVVIKKVKINAKQWNVVTFYIFSSSFFIIF